MNLICFIIKSIRADEAVQLWLWTSLQPLLSSIIHYTEASILKYLVFAYENRLEMQYKFKWICNASVICYFYFDVLYQHSSSFAKTWKPPKDKHTHKHTLASWLNLSKEWIILTQHIQCALCSVLIQYAYWIVEVEKKA